MKSERGSITIISLAMLLFLLVVAVAWLPMMTAEKNAAASDYKEQQAWYAAEAGYNKALVALKNKETITTGWLTGLQDMKDNKFLHNSLTGEKVEQDKVWYAVSITEIIDGIETDITEVNDNTQYTVTAVGSCNGVRKVIRKAYTVGDTGNNGGSDEPSDPDAGDYLKQSLIYSGQKINVHGNNEKITLSGGKISSINITGNPKWSGDTDVDEKKKDKDKDKFLADMRTKIKSQTLDKTSYTQLKNISITDNLEVPEDVQYCLENNDSIPQNITGSYNSLLFINNSTEDDCIITGDIRGPSNGSKRNPFIIIYNNPKGGKLIFKAKMSGDIKVISSSSIILDLVAQYDGVGMFLSNVNVEISCPTKFVFISANNDVVLRSGTKFTGQIQAWNEVTIIPPIGTLYFDETALTNYGFPKELIANPVPKKMK